MKKRSIYVGLVGCLIVSGASVARGDGGALHQAKQTPPVQMGTSGGSVADHSNAFCCGGTLGSAVLRDGALHILSNNHILARSGSATVGEDTLQPGLIDSGCSSSGDNIVGDFIGDVVPLGTANVDVGLSLARSGQVDTSGAILDIGVPCNTTQAATVGLPVMKSGRTTGTTTGNITSINTSVSIQYQKGCNSGKKFTISYTNQLVTGAMSAGGDSGSLLVSNDGTLNPVGLLYAGSSSTTIYNPIQDVVNALTAGGHTFSFVGNSCGAAAASADSSVGPAVAFATPAANDLQAAIQIKERNEAALLRMPGVIGVGVGAANDNPFQAVIVVYVDNTHGNGRNAIPTDVEGTNVRVIETDPFVAQ
ncbi:MAG: hypothetical protein HY287_07395 [Planctomycetes bacterium]|nr:hypothetical protein [Planctomycetota bacterium]MBI3834137.1 hypothetical protein [Planctomycetota bacterium]